MIIARISWPAANQQTATALAGRRPSAFARARNALGRVNGYMQIMIEAIASAKLRRLERELELRGIRFDRSNIVRVAPKSRSARR
jgi:hypothetical protein